MALDIINLSNQIVAHAEMDIAQFARDIVRDPSYALTWCREAFLSAATINVWQQILAEATIGAGPDELRANLLECILLDADSKENGTGTKLLADATRKARLAAYARLKLTDTTES